MKTKPFRNLPKEPLAIQVPARIAELVRTKAARERRSVASVGSEALAIGLGLDPAVFGIETGAAT